MLKGLLKQDRGRFSVLTQTGNGSNKAEGSYMSLFCLCVIDNFDKEDLLTYTNQIEMHAKEYNRGIKYEVDWPEPIVEHIKKDSLIINIVDCPENDNCEMFLLPDNWYFNESTNKLPFKDRIKFLQDISELFINNSCSVDIYLGQSGTNPEEFIDVWLKNSDLVDYLTNTIGVYGIDDGVHINIV